MPRKQKTENKKLLEAIDGLWAKIVKCKAHNKCELCPRVTGRLDAHHIEGRHPRELRWDLENGVALCFKCHRLGVHDSASSVQAEFREKLKKHKGEEMMRMLELMRNSYRKYHIQDLRDLKDHFTTVLESHQEPL